MILIACLAYQELSAVVLLITTHSDLTVILRLMPAFWSRWFGT